MNFSTPFYNLHPSEIIQYFLHFGYVKQTDIFQIILKAFNISYKRKNSKILKRSFMGETEEEVFSLLRQLREHGVSLLTIGQYLRPTKNQVTIKEFIKPDQFEKYGKMAKKLGFTSVHAGPYVRSSYMAEEFYKERANNFS